jgi:glycosyltransferase involved in cell wall biosynthesis
MIREIDAVYPCSQDGSSYLSSSFPAYAAKIHTAYLGTADYGLNPIHDKGVFTIVSCSNIVPVKQVQLIAEALSEVKKQGFGSFSWICIGDGPLLDELKRAVREELDLLSNVSFLGRISNHAVFELYKKQHIDVFINVSENEGLPVSLMEAQSFGIPCLATDVGGTSEIVSNEVGVLLSENTSAEVLAGHIVTYIQIRSTTLPKVREQARKNWLAKFNAEYNYTKWVQMLKSYKVN